MQPKYMSETRLKDELSKRNLYEKNQPKWALVIALEEAIRKESRILRLHQKRNAYTLTFLCRTNLYDDIALS